MNNEEVVIDLEFNPEGKNHHEIATWASTFLSLAPYWLKKVYLEIALKDECFGKIEYYKKLWQNAPSLPNKPGSCCVILESKNLMGLKEAFILPLQWSNENSLYKHDDRLPKTLKEVAERAKNIAIKFKDKENSKAFSDVNLSQYFLVPAYKNSFPKLPDSFITWDSGFLPLLVSLLSLTNSELEINPYVWSTGACADTSNALDTINGLAKKIRAAQEFNVKRFFYPAGSDLPASIKENLDIDLVELKTNVKLFESIIPLLDEILYPPNINSENEKIKAYYKKIRDKNKKDVYFRELILPKSVKMLKEKQPFTSQIIEKRLIAFLGGNPELIEILSRVLEVTEVVLFMTKKNSEKLLQLKKNIAENKIKLNDFVVEEKDFGPFCEEIQEILSHVSKDKVNIFDITSGKKYMSIALVYSVQSENDQIVYLDSEYNDNELVPFSQKLRTIPIKLNLPKAF